MSRTLRASAYRLRGRLGMVRSRSAYSSHPFSAPAPSVRSPNRVARTASPRWSPRWPTSTRSCRTSERQIQTQQESVNKSIVDVQNARDAAVAAQQEVDANQARLKDANAGISAAQQRFDTFASSTYVNGPSASYVMATDPADVIDTASTGQTLSISTQQVGRPIFSGPGPNR